MSEATALQKTETPPNSNNSILAEQVQLEQQMFELAQRKAAIYAKSSLVPKEYANNIGNVLIAENMAKRMGADLLMVMQNLYIVQGRPGWSSQFLIATFNSNGRFSAIKYRFEGDDPKANEYGCTAYCTELATGEVIEGTQITWGMATAEGWTTKNGSKWKTMPAQMFRYRAAAFLIRATAPEIGMGLLTKEELDDITPSNGEIAKQGVAGLKDRLAAASDEPTTVDGEVVDDTPEVTHTDATINIIDEVTPEEGSAIENETEKAESSLIDLRTAAGDLYATLAGDRLTEADTFIDGKNIRSLGKEKLNEFLKRFGS